mgnify:CR=1 FL=1
MNPKFFWYLSRASGIVAAVLLALTLIWGLLLTTRLIEKRGLPAWLNDLHRHLGGLTVVFLGVHMFSLMGDRYSHFSLSELFVPLASASRKGYEAGPVAWGVAALWALLVVEVSSLVMRRMPRKVWRGIHYLSYPVALLVAVHVLTGGTDTSNPVFQLSGLVLIAALTFLTIYRMLGGREKPERVDPRVAAAARAAARSAASPGPSDPAAGPPSAVR